jgi:hypothetical protein
LLAAAGAAEASSGVARLLPPASPFGIDVSPAGEPRWNVAFELSGLPDPTVFGDYRTYVAWATTAQLAPVVKLG